MGEMNNLMTQQKARVVFRLRILITLSLMALLILAACTAPAAPATTPSSAETAPADVVAEGTEASGDTSASTGTLRAGMEIPVQLDPAFASSDVEIAILNAVYDYLVDVDVENNIQPRLATSWERSEDGLTFTFTLSPDATFHDGSPVTAADVVWTFDRLRDPASELPTVELYSNVESIVAEDDQTVVFTLQETNPFFLYDLSDNHALIVKAETEDPADFNGSGPFQVVDYSAENRITLEANPNYFIEGKPGVANLEIIFFSDQAAAVAAIRSGQIDLLMRMPTPLFQTLQESPELVTYNIPTNGFDLVRLRSDQEPGSDPNVVQAMKLATDADAIIDIVTLGLGAPSKNSPIGPTFQQWHAGDLEVPARDPEAARALLAEAGYPDGLELDLHTPDTGDRPDLAVVLKEQWAEAGINVNVIVEPESVYYGDDGWLEVPLGITGWGHRPYPQFYLEVMLTCDAVWNESHFCDEEFDQLVEVAGTTLDEEDRAQAYAEIQRILLERGPIIIPYFFPQLGAIHERFEGFEMKPFPGRTDLAAISLAE
jgi:peptide/nickel transport system substrate-binding protein